MSQPLIVHEFAPGYRLGSGVTPVYTDVTHRVHSRYRHQRGQQYQRGQAQAGTYNANWRNTDGYLDPSNVNSPYWPGLLSPFVPVRVRAQYPATPNLLTGDQATGGEATPVAPGAIPASMNIGGFYATPTIVSSGSAWQGGQVYQSAVGASVASGHELLTVSSVPIRAASSGLPATTYAWSVYVRSATTGANPTVAAAIEWSTPTGLAVSTSTGSTSVLTGSPTATWTRVTVVATPPAGATVATLAVMLSGTVPGSVWNFQADGLQTEILAQGVGAATAWQQPGTWYPMWGGATVADPRVFTGDGVPDDSGNYSMAQISATDVIGLMAQDKLNDAYIEALLTYGPDFIYTLSLPSTTAGSVAAQDWTGQRPPIAGYATGGSYTPGASATPNVSTDATSVPQGVSTAVVGTVSAFFYDPGPNGGPSNGWDIGGVDMGTSGVVGPPASSPWTRLITFNMSNLNSQYEPPAGGDNGAPYLRSTLFSFGGYGPSNYPSLCLSMYQPITWSGGIPTYGSRVMWLEGYTTAGTHLNVTWPAPGLLLDNAQWQLCAMSLDSTGQNFTIRLQGLTGGMTKYTAGTGGTDFRSTGLGYYQTDTLGFQAEPWLQQGAINGITTPGPLWQWGMNGQLGPVAQLPFEINDTQYGDLATAWATAYAGDHTGARASRLLAWGGWAGSSTVDTGSTTMGGAGGLGSSTGPYSGQAPLSQLQALALAEHGMVYAQADGTPAVRGRTYRWSQVSAAAVFGEGPPMGVSGEIPYTKDLAIGFDTTQTINAVQWTVGSSGPGHTSVPVSSLNVPSITASYPQSVQQSLNTADTTQALNVAQWLSNAQDVPADRISTLRVDAAGTPGVWGQVLGLELDTLVKVNRRPLGGNVLSVGAFLENVSWDVVPNKSAVVTYQASPQVFDEPWIPALFHTTLNVQANAGAGSFTINAPQGAASLLLSQMIPGGWQLVLDPANPAITETVTIAPSGIPTTTLGWTTAVVTINGTLAHTHAANAVVCEPPPAGVTDPTIYDYRSILAPAQSTVAVQANSGTNTVTISALAGAQFNAPNQLIPPGWTLWLSPGTPRFEAVTVAPRGVPSAPPGWRQVTLTLTANLTQTHVAGDTVCDPLPAGVTNPAGLVGTTILGF